MEATRRGRPDSIQQAFQGNGFGPRICSVASRYQYTGCKMAVRHRGTGEIIREGQVYVLHNESLGENIFKIGMSTGDVERRAAGVAKHFNISGGLKVVFAQPTRDVDQLERRVHLKLSANQLTPDHPVSRKFGLEKGTEFFYGLTRDKIERTIAASVKGLEREDTWCIRLKANPELGFLERQRSSQMSQILALHNRHGLLVARAPAFSRGRGLARACGTSDVGIARASPRPRSRTHAS